MLNVARPALGGNALAKLPRIVAATACLATSVVFVAPKPAEACFFVMTQIDDCNWVSDYLCSYHNDGTGGYYLARSGIVSIC